MQMVIVFGLTPAQNEKLASVARDRRFIYLNTDCKRKKTVYLTPYGKKAPLSVLSW